MEIPDFLNSNTFGAGHDVPSLNDKSKSYVDNMVRVLAANQTIEKAYFGLLYNEELDNHDLFLAVEHNGGDEEISVVLDLVRDTYLPSRSILYTSKDIGPELFKLIRENNFPFYTRTKAQLLNMAIMKQWFDPVKYQTELMFQIKTGRVTSLFKDFDPTSNRLDFQTFIRNGEQFIPLFSDEEMIFKSGLLELPADLTPLEFDWVRVNEAVDGKFRQHTYVLNPDTSFEVEFRT